MIGGAMIQYIMTLYYDAILLLIPMALLGITGLLIAAGVSLTTAVMAGGVLSAGLIGHAMFVNGPGGTRESASEAARMDFDPASGD